MHKSSKLIRRKLVEADDAEELHLEPNLKTDAETDVEIVSEAAGLSET